MLKIISALIVLAIGAATTRLWDVTASVSALKEWSDIHEKTDNKQFEALRKDISVLDSKMGTLNREMKDGQEKIIYYLLNNKGENRD